MSILIKGMEMPYGCADCDFCGGIIMPDGIYCCDCPTEASHGKNISDAINNDARADFCPLIEIPTPHGRLIDADAVNKAMDERIKKLKDDKSIYEASCVSTALDMFAPTVIEPEGSEE